ncbi:MAG TPA: ABC transporter permease [Planctomycetota bacterium]|nr:ABC transporter permease [Planctomycetota bacterium]HRR78799.1 ABC transporter permease [Planctomycetota bacterium]HRT94938.1 ABC transporter permease [Planctomycetota bacterium]
MKHLLSKSLPFLFLATLVLLLSWQAPGFATVDNIGDVLRYTAVFVIMGVGMTFVIVSGGIDLSVGSVLAFSSVVAAWSMRSLMPLVSSLVGPSVGLCVGLSLVVGMATGAAWGLVNGLLITRVKLPPFIATLATMGMARGFAHLLARALTGGATTIEITQQEFKFLGQGFVPTAATVAVVILGYYMLNHMRVGRYSFAIGSNVEAARYSGIRVERYTLYVYLLLGVLSGLAGMIEASMLGAGDSTLGDAYELRTIAAVVIGGASLSGGQGTIIGTLIGALIMGVIKDGCILLNISFFWQLVVISLLIIVAVAFDNFQRRRTGA